MTAIDTSKLKNNTAVNYKYRGEFIKGVLTKCASQWVDTFNELAVFDIYGNLMSGITDLVFPDHQEQDRVEYPNRPWPKPGDKALNRHGNTVTVLHWHKEENLLITPKWVCFNPNNNEYEAYEVDDLRPIPKPDPDGELIEILEQYDNGKIGRKELISQIKSLLAAKVPSRKEWDKVYDDVWHNETSAPIDCGWITMNRLFALPPSGA